MKRLAVLLLLLSLPALAQDNGYQKRPPRDRNTSEPAMWELSCPPQDYIVIDRRPSVWSPFSTDLDWNTEQPKPIIPFKSGVIIVTPDPIEPDSGCNAKQEANCKTDCKGSGKSFVACEMDIQWNADGSTTRTRICTCTSGADPVGRQIAGVPGVFLETVEIRVAE